MCQACESPVPDSTWTLEKALRALKYHTKVLQHLLEKLDLPFVHVQELRLALRRPRRRAHIAGEARWRTASWGAIYMAVESKCPVWRQVRNAAACSCAHSQDEKPSTFGCLNSSESALLTEVELHLCAALRHLSRASEVALLPSASVDVGSSFDCLSPKVAHLHSTEIDSKDVSASDLICNACEDIPNSDAYISDDVSARLSFPDTCKLNERRMAHLGTLLHESFQRLMNITWAFHLRAELCNALLCGNVLQAASWAMRLLGIAEPWGLRKVQDLVLQMLELVNECLSNSGLQGDIDTPNAWGVLRGACTAYLGVPIIPRFEARFRQSISRLADLGLRTDTLSEPLDKALVALLEPTEADVPRQFDGSGASLEAFRSRDDLHKGFSQAMAASAATHVDGCCQLELCSGVLAGIEAIASAGAGCAMPVEKRQQLLQVVGSVPRALSSATELTHEASEEVNHNVDAAPDGSTDQSGCASSPFRLCPVKSSLGERLDSNCRVFPQQKLRQLQIDLLRGITSETLEGADMQQAVPQQSAAQESGVELELQEDAPQQDGCAQRASLDFSASPAQASDVEAGPLEVPLQQAQTQERDSSPAEPRQQPASLLQARIPPGRKEKFAFEPKIRVLPLGPLQPRSLPEMPLHVAVAA